LFTFYLKTNKVYLIVKMKVEVASYFC
jgi:hypothetical protein